mmetsp:Transcript_25081/g.64805  ORF Transcript_25081/g.64805 Transcript_25081/m.64805 type:complete len:257 (-) Transcript_25081:567-1337(-)
MLYRPWGQARHTRPKAQTQAPRHAGAAAATPQLWRVGFYSRERPRGVYFAMVRGGARHERRLTRRTHLAMHQLDLASTVWRACALAQVLPGARARRRSIPPLLMRDTVEPPCPSCVGHVLFPYILVLTGSDLRFAQRLPKLGRTHRLEEARSALLEHIALALECWGRLDELHVSHERRPYLRLVLRGGGGAVPVEKRVTPCRAHIAGRRVLTAHDRAALAILEARRVELLPLAVSKFIVAAEHCVVGKVPQLMVEG